MKMTLIRLMKAYDICQKADEHILQKKEYEREIEEATKKVAKKIVNVVNRRGFPSDSFFQI